MLIYITKVKLFLLTHTICTFFFEMFIFAWNQICIRHLHDIFLNKTIQYVQVKTSDLFLHLTILCVQEGAMDLLKELKSFNMTLKLLQVCTSMLS